MCVLPKMFVLDIAVWMYVLMLSKKMGGEALTQGTSLSCHSRLFFHC